MIGITYESSNTCVCCGDVIPEGSHICRSCAIKYGLYSVEKKRDIKSNITFLKAVAMQERSPEYRRGMVDALSAVEEIIDL